MKSVCVIGAGVSGLIATKVFLDDGFSVTTFEKGSSFGGLWSAENRYPGLHSQSSRESYFFPDFPPRLDGKRRAWEGSEFAHYVESFVSEFDMAKHIRLSTEVVSVEEKKNGTAQEKAEPSGQNGDGPEQVGHETGVIGAFGWRVCVRPCGGHSGRPESDSVAIECLDFDLVVVCAGVFSNPAVPSVPGESQYSGRILHSSQVRSTLAPPTRALIVGCGKSAADVAADAAACSSAGDGRVTLLFRRAHRSVPEVVMGTHWEHFMLSRYGTSFFPPRVMETSWDRFLHGTRAGRRLWRLNFVVADKLYDRTVQFDAKRYPQLEPFRSSAPVVDELGVGHVEPRQSPYKAVREGRLVAKRGEVKRFLGGTAVEVQTYDERRGSRGTDVVDADVVVFATGFKFRFPYFSRELCRRLGVPAEGDAQQTLRLHRVVAPLSTASTIGFVGFLVSANHTLNAYAAAHWLADLFSGRITLPPVEEMRRELDERLAWQAKVMPGAPVDGCSYLFWHLRFVDELLRDMRVPTRRERDFFKEFFVPYHPGRLRNLREQRLARDKSEALPTAGDGVEGHASPSRKKRLLCCMSA